MIGEGGIVGRDTMRAFQRTGYAELARRYGAELVDLNEVERVEVAREFGTPCVVAGFEPIDILHAIEMILRQLLDGRAEVEIQYRRIVRPEGNPEAVRVMYEAYCGCDADWRGIGVIPASGLRLRDELRRFDAEAVFGVEVGRGRPDRRCICGLIMQGMKLPPDCRLFGGECRPESPVGPCMVSSEGACAAYYKYRPL